MNSISYLDSVLSRSFGPPERRPSSSYSGKRSRSHSSLPGSRRASSTTPSTPSGSSSLRRWSQDEDQAAVESSRSAYNYKLRRTGSIPAGVYSTQALDTDDSEGSDSQQRTARWSGLWGLTGWIDEAIHPGSRPRSRKGSDSEHSARRAKRIPSLDDLLMGTTAPQRDTARRTASSGSGANRLMTRSRSSSSDEEHSGTDRRSKRRSRFGQVASLTLTSNTADQLPDRWTPGGVEHSQHDDPALMSEKDREDIVEFDGGDFAPEEAERPRERTLSQDSLGSSWGESSSQSHGQASIESVALDEAGADESVKVQDGSRTQDLQDEKHVDSETLLEAAKGDTQAMEAVAQEDPTSSVVCSQPSEETPKKPDKLHEETTPTQMAPPSYDEAARTQFTLSPTPTISRRRSKRCSTAQELAEEPVPPSSASSVISGESDRSVERTASLSKSKRKRGSRSSSAAASEAERDEPRAWLASRGPLSKTGLSNTSSARRQRFSTSRAIKRTLTALRDLILTILLCPMQCIRVIRGRRAMKAEERVDSTYERSHVPILEKDAGQGGKTRARPLSLRFEPEINSKHDLEKCNSINGRPRTPRPERKASPLLDEEPVTEEQAAEKGQGWKALESGPRTPSKLLPNPHRIDPMLAHNKEAEPINEAMAEYEARMEAERQSRIAKSRAARRAAASQTAPSDHEKSTTSSALISGKVPRGPSSSIIHHSPKILVLDLDETLIHSTSRSPSLYISGGRTTTSGFLGLETVGAILGLRANDNPRRIRPHMVEVVLDGRSVLYHVYKRPWVDYFLRKVASWYTVVVFTASVQEYADPVIDWLDQGRGLISARLFRESCSFKNGSYVKNLAVVDQDLAKVCLVDNSPASYATNKANGIPIEGWTHDPNDEALLDLLPILDSLRFATDVRHILGIRGFSSAT